MAFGVDPEQVHAIARDVAARAGEVAAAADRVRTREVVWVGPAGDAFRARRAALAGQVASGQAAAAASAEEIHRLARLLAERQAAVQAAMNEVQARVADASRIASRLGDVAGELLNSVQAAALGRARELLDQARTLPPPGSPEWLDVARELRRR